MTALTDATSAPRRTLFPDHYNGFPRCQLCFRRKPNTIRFGAPWLAQCLNPRNPGTLINTCPDCYHHLHNDGPLILPAGDELAETWTTLARWHINGETTDDQISRALATLAPGLDSEAANAALEELEEALLFAQRVEFGDITLAEVEPELRDPEVLAEAAQTRVSEALRELIGGHQ